MMKPMLDSTVNAVIHGGADAVTSARSANNDGDQTSQVIGGILKNLLGGAMKMALGSVLGGL